MEFGLSEKEESLKREVAEFAKKELPPDWLGAGPYAELRDWDFTMSISKKLAQKGWLARQWPKEFGGEAASPIENLIFQDEAAYWGLPGTAMGYSGIRWVGPCLIRFGTEEQRKKYLPPIIAGEPDGIWCTGYSEPGAGTDIASVKTRAVRVGNEYVINGNKIWNTGGHHARWCWLLARTNTEVPKHKGLSLIIVDMKSPGISLRPILDIFGDYHVNELFFDDVRVPVDNLVGQEDRGWYHLVDALELERSVIGFTGDARRLLDELTKYVKEENIHDLMLSLKLANAALEIEVARVLAYRIPWLESKGISPGAEASAIKVFSSEAKHRLAQIAMEIVGPFARLPQDSKHARLQRFCYEFYVLSLIRRFGGGTNEIQRDIIAQRGLGLPRDRN